MTYRIKWGDGVVLVKCGDVDVTLTFGNGKLTFYPREVSLECKYSRFYVEDVGKKRYAYVLFREPLKPFEPNGHGDVKVQCSFEIRSVDLGFSKYITIITPGVALYEYAIVSEELLVVMSRVKKRVYFETLSSGVNIYYQ